MHTSAVRRHKPLWLALAALMLGTAGVAHADNTTQAPSTTSNDTNEKVHKSTTLSTVNVNAQSLAGGLMAVQDQPKQVSTITAQAIAEVPITADYTQIINSAPGVNSASSDGFGLTDASSYTIRGFNASEIGVTLDGVPVNDAGNYIPYASEYGEARNYESINVSQGSADLDMPDLGAVGGHISFITRTPTQNFNVYAGQTVGSNNALSTFLRINTGAIGPVRSWISISRNSDDKWRGGGYNHIDRIQAKSVWTIDDNDSVTANFNLNREHNYFYMPLTKAQAAQYGYSYDYGTTWTPTPAGGFPASALYSDPATITQINYFRLFQNPFKSWVASLDGEFKFGSNLSLSVIPYFQFGDGNGSFGGFLPLQFVNGKPVVQANQFTDGQYTAYEAYRPITYRPGINAKFTLALGMDNTLDWGIWYERSRQLEYIDASYVDPQTGAPESVWGDNKLLTYSNGQIWKNYSEYDVTTVEKAFVEDTWTFNDAWTFNAGVAYLHTERNNQFVLYPGNPDPVDWTSYQNSDNRYHRFLPSVSASWKLDDNNQLYYSLTRTFRAPPDAATYGNSRLGLPAPLPESAWSNEIGWRFTHGPLTLHTDAYLANMGNRTAVGLDPNTFINYYINAGRTRMAGLNAEGNLDLGHGFTLYSSYTYTQAKVEQDLNLPATADTAAAFYATKGKQFPGTPRNMAYLGARYSANGLTLNLNGKFTGSEYGDFLNTERVSSNFTLNGSASYELPDFSVLHKPTIAINALNLLNRRYLMLPSSPTLSAETSSPTYYVGAPRQWYLTLSTELF